MLSHQQWQRQVTWTDPWTTEPQIFTVLEGKKKDCKTLALFIPLVTHSPNASSQNKETAPSSNLVQPTYLT